MLKWIHIWWRAISQWYNKPRKIYKGSVKDGGYSAKNSRNLHEDKHSRCNADANEDIDSESNISQYGITATGNNTTKKRITNEEKKSLGVSCGNLINGKDVSSTVNRVEFRSEGFLLKHGQYKQNNGYLISDRLHDSGTVSRRKSKSKSPSPPGSCQTLSVPLTSNLQLASQKRDIIGTIYESTDSNDGFNISVDDRSKKKNSLKLKQPIDLLNSDVKATWNLQESKSKSVSYEIPSTNKCYKSQNEALSSESKENVQKSKFTNDDHNINRKNRNEKITELKLEREKVSSDIGFIRNGSTNDSIEESNLFSNERNGEEIEWSVKTLRNGSENVSRTVEKAFYRGQKITLATSSKTFTTKASIVTNSTVLNEAENAYKVLKERSPECTVVLEHTESAAAEADRYITSRKVIRPSELRISQYSQDDAFHEKRDTLSADTPSSKMAYRRSVSADSSPYRTYHAPTVERISVYDRYMERERKELLARLSERRKSMESASHDIFVPYYSDEFRSSTRRSPGPIIITKTMRRKMSERTTRSLEMLETRTRYSDGYESPRSFTKDYSKYGSSSRQNLNEGMIRCKIREHMSNIIGKRLYADEDVMYSSRSENPLYVRDGMETDQESTITSEIDLSSEQNGLKTDEESEDYLADEENDETLKITRSAFDEKPVVSYGSRYEGSTHTEDQTRYLEHAYKEMHKEPAGQFGEMYKNVHRSDVTKPFYSQDNVIAEPVGALRMETFDLTLSLATINFGELSSAPGVRIPGLKSAWRDGEDSGHCDTVIEDDILTPTFQVCFIL